MASGSGCGARSSAPSRDGPVDAVIGRYAARVNGLTELFVTKLDILSGFETLKICTGYRAEGGEFEDFPPNQSLFHKAEPIYEELEGWDEEIDSATSFEDLPKQAREYVRRMEQPVTRVVLDAVVAQHLPGLRRVVLLVEDRRARVGRFDRPRPRTEPAGRLRRA